MFGFREYSSSAKRSVSFAKTRAENDVTALRERRVTHTFGRIISAPAPFSFRVFGEHSEIEHKSGHSVFMQEEPPEPALFEYDNTALVACSHLCA